MSNQTVKKMHIRIVFQNFTNVRTLDAKTIQIDPTKYNLLYTRNTKLYGKKVVRILVL